MTLRVEKNSTIGEVLDIIREKELTTLFYPSDLCLVHKGTATPIEERIIVSHLRNFEMQLQSRKLLPLSEGFIIFPSLLPLDSSQEIEALSLGLTMSGMVKYRRKYDFEAPLPFLLNYRFLAHIVALTSLYHGYLSQTEVFVQMTESDEFGWISFDDSGGSILIAVWSSGPYLLMALLTSSLQCLLASSFENIPFKISVPVPPSEGDKIPLSGACNALLANQASDLARLSEIAPDLCFEDVDSLDQLDFREKIGFFFLFFSFFLFFFFIWNTNFF